jgi:Acetyltransferase (GNAT) domain
VVNPVQDPAWDIDFRGESSKGIFYSAAWARVLSESYGYKPLYLTCSQNGQPSGCLPLMEVNSLVTGKRGISLPFTDECGPGCNDPSEREKLIYAAVSLGRERGWRSFECRGGSAEVGWTCEMDGYLGHRINLLALPPDPMAGFHPAVRRAIRKAEREGVRVERSESLTALREYYTLHCSTRRRHGRPPQPWSFFKCIYHYIMKPGFGFTVLARHLERPIAGAVFLHGGRQCIYKYGASDVDYQGLRPSNLIMWESIRWLRSKGFEVLDLGRTAANNSGLRRFKLGWGASEHRLHYVKYNYREARFARGDAGEKFWPATIFKRLPIPLLRGIGTVLYRHWA